jgi:hypothetical protein
LQNAVSRAFASVISCRSRRLWYHTLDVAAVSTTSHIQQTILRDRATPWRRRRRTMVAGLESGANNHSLQASRSRMNELLASMIIWIVRTLGLSDDWLQPLVIRSDGRVEPSRMRPHGFFGGWSWLRFSPRRPRKPTSATGGRGNRSERSSSGSSHEAPWE